MGEKTVRFWLVELGLVDSQGAASYFLETGRVRLNGYVHTDGEHVPSMGDRLSVIGGSTDYEIAIPGPEESVV